MPYAFGLDPDGRPDAEAQTRLDKAFALAREKITHFDVTIFLGAGMPERTRRYGIASLAEASSLYLQGKGWPRERIVMRPVGYSTMTETQTLCDYLITCKCYPGQMLVEVVSSWWHAPRVWAACRLIFGRGIKIYASPSGHSGFMLVYDIAREILALPLSVYRARMARKQCA